MNKHLSEHGDGVKDVAFTVDDTVGIFNVRIIKYFEEDENGKVILAIISTYGDTSHTFVQRSDFKGIFLPNYVPIVEKDPLESLLPATKLNFIDHCVGNQPDLEMVSACELYEKQLGFHRFWSVDDEQIHTEYSALRSIVMADWDEIIKMPINEPAKGKRQQLRI